MWESRDEAKKSRPDEGIHHHVKVLWPCPSTHEEHAKALLICNEYGGTYAMMNGGVLFKRVEPTISSEMVVLPSSTNVTVTTTVTGVMTSTLHEDEVRRKTTKFMMENKTIFEELAKL